MIDPTAIVVAAIVGAPATIAATFAAIGQVLTRRDTRAALAKSEAAEAAAIASRAATVRAASVAVATAEAQNAVLATVATQEKLAEVSVKADGKIDRMQKTIDDLSDELRRLKADPTATTPETGGKVNIAEGTGAVSTNKGQRHDDAPKEP